MSALAASQATGRLGDTSFSGPVVCQIEKEIITYKIQVVTTDGGFIDNDGDGFAMRLSSGSRDGQFKFNIVLGETTYTNVAKGDFDGMALRIEVPELEYLDGNGTIDTLIEIICEEGQL